MPRAMECVDREGGPVTGWVIHCPACGHGHKFDAPEHPNKITGASWSFNGDLERPTFSPSMLIRDRVDGVDRYVCHSFVRDGRIEFLGDCTHDLAGQTVELTEP